MLFDGNITGAQAADPGHCTLDKYALEHEGTIQYDQTIPKLEQFTLCAWMRFINHSGDHSIFTYSGKIRITTRDDRQQTIKKNQFELHNPSP